MKRISYIVFGVAFLALASCQKEVIVPNDSARNASDVEWISSKEDSKNGSYDKAADPNNSGSGSINGAASSDSGSGSSGSSDDDTNDTGITDPNNDPDAAKKKGKK